MRDERPAHCALIAALSTGSMRRSGAAGNLRLTSLVGIVLLVLLAIEGATIPWIRPLLSVHIFVGMLLLAPVALKLTSTGYRFARYYTGGPEYVREGPPAPLMRLLVAPVLVLSTITLFATGVVLLAIPHGGTVSALHKASFIVCFGAAIHVLAYTVRAPKRALGPLGPPSPAGAPASRSRGSLSPQGSGSRSTYPLANPCSAGTTASSGTAPSPFPPGRWRLPACSTPDRPAWLALPPARPARAAVELLADRRPKQQPRAHRLPRRKRRVDRFRAPRPRRCVLHSRLALDHHQRGVQRHAGAGGASRSPHRLALRPRGHRRLLTRLPEHPRRRLPSPERRYDGRGHPELPHCRALPAWDDRPHPRRQLRPRPTPRVLEPQRRYPAPGRRPARHRDRRVDRPSRRARAPGLVGAVSGLLPLRRPTPAERPILVSSFTYPKIVEPTPRGR